MTAGRPTKLTRKLTSEIAMVVSTGNTLDKSAEYHGVDGSTAYRWQQRGRREVERLAKSKRAKPRRKERLHREFCEAIKKARAKAQVRNVAVINNAAETTWTAAAWWLERSDPQNWGRRQRLEHTGADGGPVAVEAEVHFYLPDNGRGKKEGGGQP